MTSPRRYPVGAESSPHGGVHFRVWAPIRKRVAVVLEGPEPRASSRWRPKATATSRHTSPTCQRRHPLPLPPRRRPHALSGPRLPLPAGRPARPVAGRRPARVPLDRRGLAGRRRCRGRSSTRCTSARSRRKAPGRPPRASCRSWRTLGITVPRGDAGRRLPGPVRLGLRRRQPVRPDPALRHARRLPPVRRPRPRSSASASSSTSSTTTSARTATTCRQFARHYFTDKYQTEWGEAINFDGPDCRPGPRVLRRQRRLLDRRVPPRRPAARRDPDHLRRHSTPKHILAEIGRRRARGGRGPVDDHRQRERAAARRARPAGRAGRATGSTRCGTTTSTTPRWSP